MSNAGSSNNESQRTASPGAPGTTTVPEESRDTASSVISGGEDRYGELLSGLPVAIYTCDAAGRVTFFNEAAAELWGRRPELGKDLWCGSWRIYLPDGSSVPLDSCPMALVIQNGQPVSGKELVIERPDGTRRNVLVHPEPMREASGPSLERLTRS